MKNISDKLREGSDILGTSSYYLANTADYVDKGSKIAGYWLNSDERKNIKTEAERWRKKTSRMVKMYIVLWIVMIILTIIVCVNII